MAIDETYRPSTPFGSGPLRLAIVVSRDAIKPYAESLRTSLLETLIARDRKMHARMNAKGYPLRETTSLCAGYRPRKTANVEEPVGVMTRSPNGSPLGVIVFTMFVWSGYIKQWPILRNLDVDLTILSGSLVVASVLWRLCNGRVRIAELGKVAGLWLLFAPGVVMTLNHDAGLQKSAVLFSFSLLAVCAPFALLNSWHSLRWWLLLQVALGGCAGILVLLGGTDDAFGRSLERVTIEGSTTILSSRLIFAAVVILMVAVIHGKSLRLRLEAVIGVAALLLIGLVIGSRGPFFASIIAFGAMLCIRNDDRPAKLVGSASLIAVGVGAFLTLHERGIFGVSRLLSALGGDVSDTARTTLWLAAWRGFTQHPFGQGWGSYSLTGVAAQSAGSEFSYPHNILLEIAFEAGFIAVLGFVLFSISCLMTLREVMVRTALLGGGLFSLALYWALNALVSSDINGNRATWAALGVALAVGQLLETDRNASGGCLSRPGKGSGRMQCQRAHVSRMDAAAFEDKRGNLLGSAVRKIRSEKRST